ncbi:MAG: PAS domain S-box protein [Candidatus Methanoperedens sp.]|nr:PAS domain S-box protein [Candidatus Methanoperedens sp.]
MTEINPEKPIGGVSSLISTYRIVLTLVLLILFSEIVSHSIIPHLSGFLGALFDSLLLVTILSPLLYLFMFKPILFHINQRRLVEEALQKSEIKTRSIFQAIPDMLFMINKGAVFMGFKAAKGMEPLMPAQAFLGKKVSEVLSPKLAEETMKHIENVFMTGNAILFEYKLPQKDTIHEYEAKVSRISGDEVLCIVRDITDRKKAEIVLKENEERFRLISESANDAIITADSKGDIIFWNNAAYKIFGYDKEEVIGKPLTILMPEIYRDEHRNGLKRLAASGESHVIGKTVELSGLRKDSTLFPLELSLSTWKAGGAIFFTGILRDTTEQKHAEELLRCSEGRLSKFMNSATDAFTIWDSKLNLVELNTVASRYLPRGVRISEVIGKNIKVLEPDAKPSGRYDQFLNVIKTGEPLTFEILSLQLNYDNVVVDRYLNIRAFKVDDGLGLITTDITERKRMGEELIQSEEKYHTLYESSSDAIMLLDEKGFFDCNDATLRIFGYSNKDDFIKLTPSQVSPPSQPDGMDSGLAANNKIAYAFTKGMNQFEWVHRRKNGEDFHADVLLSAFNLRGKQVLQATVRDITDRKRAQELHIENVQLENESKAKSEFLASMSHELRTPLNAILGFSDIMNMGIGGNLNEKQKEYVKDIYNAGNHLLLIIDDILDLSKVEAGKMELAIEKFSVLELLEESLTLIKNKAIKHNIEIIRDIDPRLEFMDGDKKRVKQVLFNLLSNAVKFSKEGGGTITIAVKKIDGVANFSVSDTGIGIEENNLNKLFKEFQQVDSGICRKYGGTGLGLAISKKLVELHGGKITVKSIYGKGSTFTFSIPIQHEVN